MMRNKMITLCEESYEIAKNIENFSKWIRGKLLELKDTKDSKS